MPRKTFLQLARAMEAPVLIFVHHQYFAPVFSLPIRNVKKTEELLLRACAPQKDCEPLRRKKIPFFWCQALLCTILRCGI